MTRWKSIGLILTGLVLGIISFGTMCALGCAPGIKLPNYIGMGIGLILLLVGIFFAVRTEK